MRCLEDGTAEQAKLVDSFIFQEIVLLMGFQSETCCVGKQSSKVPFRSRTETHLPS